MTFREDLEALEAEEGGLGSELKAILRLYSPNTGGGNFAGDISTRGANAILILVAKELDLATPEEMERLYRRLDVITWERQERRLQELNRGARA